MARTADEYKQLSIREFTKAAKVYESGHAGIYEMCKDDYPQMFAELEREPFSDVLDVGCGTGAVIELLHGKHPGARYVGLDLTPDMIAVAKAKGLDGCEFVVGDAEDLPFAANSFDAVLTSNSFHHYPNPERFFAGVHRVLRPGGTLLICNECSGDRAQDEKWAERIDGMTVYTDSELRAYLEQAGFGEVQVHKNEKGWLCVTARKEEQA